jgi:hypothetical protein
MTCIIARRRRGPTGRAKHGRSHDVPPLKHAFCFFSKLSSAEKEKQNRWWWQFHFNTEYANHQPETQAFPEPVGLIVYND